MNLRNWSIEHTKGLIVGILSPLLFVPIVNILPSVGIAPVPAAPAVILYLDTTGFVPA